MGTPAIAARSRRRVDQFTRQMKGPIAKWLQSFAAKVIAEQIQNLRRGKSGKLKLAKAEPVDADLLRILRLYGVRQVDQEGKAIADTLGGSWVIPPELVAAVIRDKQIKVRHITRGATQAVREEIRKILLEAEREIPQPTMATIARRIRDRCMGMHEFSEGRAALIARTEAVQNQNTGIYEGMEEAGVDVVEWLASSNPNHGDRHHEKMNGQRVKLGEKFRNPTTGNELRYPGDPRAPIEDLANCGCVLVMARVAEPKKKR